MRVLCFLKNLLEPPGPAAAPAEARMRRKAAELAIWMSRHGQQAVQERAHLRDRSEAQIYWRYGYRVALGDAIEASHGRPDGLDSLSPEPRTTRSRPAGPGMRPNR